MYIQQQLFITYLNSDNKNLLEQTTDNHFNISNVKLYNIINNTPVEAVAEIGTVALSNTTPARLIVFSNVNVKEGGVLISENENKQIYEFNSLLKLSETVTDSIKTHVEVAKENGSTSYVVQKVWYNNELVADNYLSYFSIIK